MENEDDDETKENFYVTQKYFDKTDDKQEILDIRDENVMTKKSSVDYEEDPKNNKRNNQPTV